MADPVYQLRLEKEGARGGDFTAKMAYAYGRHSLKNCKCKKRKRYQVANGISICHIQHILSVAQWIFTRNDVSQTINTSPGFYQASNPMKDQESGLGY
jgi:hypothetical protein